MARDDEPDYVFRERHPERHDVYALYDRESERVRKETFCLQDIAYGDHPRMRFDLFPGPRNAPLMIFFHGGYWQSLDKSRFSFVAEALVREGFSVALPNYPLAPEETPEAIVAAARASVPAIFEALARHGSLPACWITSGHSAGAHLSIWAGTVASYVPLARGSTFVGMVPISGIFDLRPLVGTSLNKALRLTSARAARLSPADHQLPDTLYRVVVGSGETEGFLNQTGRFCNILDGAGHDVAEVKLAGRNHYTILKDFLSPDLIVVKLIKKMVGLGRDRVDRRNDKKQAELRQL